MYKKNFTLFLIILIFSLLKIHASDSVYIAVKGKFSDVGVKLRWSASDASSWRRTNECGFMVERYVVKENGQLVDTPVKQVINSPVKAEPLNNWEQISKRSNYAAIIAQALYGDTFTVGSQSQGSISALVNISREQEQRFLTSMYASEMDYEAACMAGWGMTDSDVKRGNSYLYRVYPADTVICRDIRYGYVYIDASLQQDLPKISFFKGKFTDRMVLLTWNVQDVKTQYTSFEIRKSEDGVTFSPISDIPLMNIDGKDFVTYPDSLAANHKTYHYKIRGIDVFGDYGPWSDVIQGEGTEEFTSVPVIVKTDISDNEKAVIAWEFDSSQERMLSHFELMRSDRDKGHYEVILSDIPAEARKTVQTITKPTNYLKIAAVGKDGSRKLSLPVLVQTIDSVPPMVPTGLIGEIDTTGVVRLRWNANKDADILGYRLYRSDIDGGHLIQVNSEVVTDTAYVDTVNIKMLNRSVCYAIAGIDERYNLSDKSAVVRLSKPDVIPPMTPCFTSFNATKDGVTLRWVCATPDDVETYRMRRTDSLNDTVYIDIPKDSLSYTDNDTDFGTKYIYSIAAIDSSSNKSSESQPVAVKAVTQKKSDISVKLQKEPGIGIWILWKPKTTESFKCFEVYRHDSAGVRVIKILAGDYRSYLDRDVKPGLEYSYFIKYRLNTGAVGYTAPIDIK